MPKASFSPGRTSAGQAPSPRHEAGRVVVLSFDYLKQGSSSARIRVAGRRISSLTTELYRGPCRWPLEQFPAIDPMANIMSTTKVDYENYWITYGCVRRPQLLCSDLQMVWSQVCSNNQSKFMSIALETPRRLCSRIARLQLHTS